MRSHPPPRMEIEVNGDGGGVTSPPRAEIKVNRGGGGVVPPPGAEIKVSGGGEGVVHLGITMGMRNQHGFRWGCGTGSTFVPQHRYHRFDGFKLHSK